MEVRRGWRVARIVAALAASAPGLWQLSLQLRVYQARFRYPWDIEWLESAALYQSYRVFRGQDTFGPPKLGYLPINHPPAYPTFLGLLGHVVRLDYAMARTVSMLFFLGASALLVHELVEHDESRLQGWVTGALAVGCAAAGVPLCEGFYDMIREDMMGLFLVVFAGVLAQQKKPKGRRIALLAAVITAAVYTRFPYVFFLVWIVLFVLVRNRKAGYSLAVLSAAACGLVLVGIQFTSRGWFWMYTVSLLQDHPVDPQRFVLGLKSLVSFARFVLVLPIAMLVLGLKKALSARSVFWVGMLVCAIPAALLPYAKVGGFSNDFLPLSLLPGAATLFVATDIARAIAHHPRVAMAVRALMFAGFGVFLVSRTWDPKRYMPSAEQWRRAGAVNARLAALDGGLIIPRHAFVPIHDGHHETAQFSDMPYLDMTWSGFSGLKLGAYLDTVHARWAAVSGTEVAYTAAEIAARYQLEGTLPPAPAMIIGERSTLRWLLRWQDDERDARVLFDFEKPLEGWTATGTAFEHSPTTNRPKNQSYINGVVGAQLANSFHPTEFDAAVGTLISPPFVIDRPHIALRVGGGWHVGTRVELRIGNRVEKSATGIFESCETLTHWVWDVSALQGKEARIVLVDEDKGSWGHLLCDHIVMY